MMVIAKPAQSGKPKFLSKEYGNPEELELRDSKLCRDFFKGDWSA